MLVVCFAVCVLCCVVVSGLFCLLVLLFPEMFGFVVGVGLLSCL